MVAESAGDHEAGPASPPEPQPRMRTEEEKRKLRRDYRMFAQRTERAGDELLDCNKLQASIQDLNALHTMVTGPREQAEDSTCFAMLCERGAAAAKRVMGQGKDRSAGHFVRALKAAHVSAAGAQAEGALDPEAFGWAALARAAAHLFKSAPGLSCMLGPMDAAPKVRKAVVRQPKKALEQLVAPEEVAPAAGEQRDPAVRNMQDMHAGLLARPGAAANVAAAVLNHASFSQSVENLFALSFLVKNNKVELAKDPAGGFLVRALTDEEQEGRVRSLPPRTQAIFGFDMAAWAEWKRRVRPGDALMPHRAPVQLPGNARLLPTAGDPDAPPGPSCRKGGGSKGVKRARPPIVVDDSASDGSSDDEEAAAARARKGKQKVAC